MHYDQTLGLHFGLVCGKDVAQEVLWFAQMSFCKLKLCCQVLLREKMLSSANTCKQAKLVQAFSNRTVSLTLNM